MLLLGSFYSIMLGRLFQLKLVVVNLLGSLDEKIENNERITSVYLHLLKKQFYKIILQTHGDNVSATFFVNKTLNGDWGKDNKSDLYPEEVICIRGADISEISNGAAGNPPIRFIQLKNLNEKKLLDNDIIVEISGGSPTQSTGRVTLMTEHLKAVYATPIICTNFCRVIRCKNKSYAYYLFQAMQYWYEKEHFFRYENGTTGIKNLDLDALLKSEEIVIPDAKNLESLSNLSDLVFEFVSATRVKNEKLTELKNLYLKKFFG